MRKYKHALQVNGDGLAGGTARGNFGDGRLAAVEHCFGKGSTLLIGTNPSVAYYRSEGRANGAFFAELFRWSDKAGHVKLSNAALFARIHEGQKGSFLWLVNPIRTAQMTEVELAVGTLKSGKAVWPVGAVHDGGRVKVPARDVLILPLG